MPSASRNHVTAVLAPVPCRVVAVALPSPQPPPVMTAFSIEECLEKSFCFVDLKNERGCVFYKT